MEDGIVTHHALEHRSDFTAFYHDITSDLQECCEVELPRLREMVIDVGRSDDWS